MHFGAATRHADPVRVGNSALTVLRGRVPGSVFFDKPYWRKGCESCNAAVDDALLRVPFSKGRSRARRGRRCDAMRVRPSVSSGRSTGSSAP